MINHSTTNTQPTHEQHTMNTQWTHNDTMTQHTNTQWRTMLNQQQQTTMNNTHGFTQHTITQRFQQQQQRCCCNFVRQQSHNDFIDFVSECVNFHTNNTSTTHVLGSNRFSRTTATIFIGREHTTTHILQQRTIKEQQIQLRSAQQLHNNYTTTTHNNTFNNTQRNNILATSHINNVVFTQLGAHVSVVLEQQGCKATTTSNLQQQATTTTTKHGKNTPRTCCCVKNTQRFNTFSTPHNNRRTSMKFEHTWKTTQQHTNKKQQNFLCAHNLHTLIVLALMMLNTTTTQQQHTNNTCKTQNNTTLMTRCCLVVLGEVSLFSQQHNNNTGVNNHVKKQKHKNFTFATTTQQWNVWHTTQDLVGHFNCSNVCGCLHAHNTQVHCQQWSVWQLTNNLPTTTTTATLDNQHATTFGMQQQQPQLRQVALLWVRVACNVQQLCCTRLTTTWTHQLDTTTFSNFWHDAGTQHTTLEWTHWVTTCTQQQSTNNNKQQQQQQQQYVLKVNNNTQQHTTTHHNNTQQHTTTTHTTTTHNHNNTQQQHTTTTHNNNTQQQQHTTTTHNNNTQQQHTTTTHNQSSSRISRYQQLCPFRSLGSATQGPACPVFRQREGRFVNVCCQRVSGGGPVASRWHGWSGCVCHDEWEDIGLVFHIIVLWNHWWLHGPHSLSTQRRKSWGCAWAVDVFTLLSSTVLASA